MEQLAANYDSQATEIADGSEIAPTVIDSDEGIAATQTTQDEDEATQRLPSSLSRSVSPITPRIPDQDVDLLPPRTKRSGRVVGRFTPATRAPQATKGWSIYELTSALEAAEISGHWRRGGKEGRMIYEGVGFLVNFEATPRGSCWVQGQRAMEIHIRLNAARGNTRRSAATGGT